MISTLLDGFFAAARENERPYGFMSLMADTGALPGVTFVASAEEKNTPRDFFTQTTARVRRFASELRQGDHEFMGLLEDNGQIPQLYALTGIRPLANDVANDVANESDRPAPKSPAAPKAA